MKGPIASGWSSISQQGASTQRPTRAFFLPPPKSTNDSSDGYTVCTSCDSISYGNCLIHRGKDVRKRNSWSVKYRESHGPVCFLLLVFLRTFLSVRLARLTRCQMAGSLFSYLMKSSLRKYRVTIVSGAVRVQCVYHCDSLKAQDLLDVNCTIVNTTTIDTHVMSLVYQDIFSGGS